MQCITEAEQIESDAIRQLYLYWRSKCPEGGIPRRADIDPIDIPNLMPNIILADIEQDPFRVRYRLAGTKVVQMTGYEFTGKYLDEMALPHDEGPFLECYQTASERHLPVLARIKWHLAEDTTDEYDICILPLSDDGETVNKALAMECYATVRRAYKFIGGTTSLPGSREPDR